MSLHYLVKLKMLIAHVRTIKNVVTEINTRIYPTLTISSKFARFYNNITACGKYYKTWCTKHITHLELSTTPLTNGCRNDEWFDLGPLICSQLKFLFVQISDAYFAIFSHACNQMDSNLAICNNPML